MFSLYLLRSSQEFRECLEAAIPKKAGKCSPQLLPQEYRGAHTFPENQHAAAGSVTQSWSFNVPSLVPLTGTHEINPVSLPMPSLWVPSLLPAPTLFCLPTRPALLRHQKATEKCNVVQWHNASTKGPGRGRWSAWENM